MKKGIFSTLKTAALTAAAAFFMTSAASAAVVTLDGNDVTAFSVPKPTGIAMDLTTVLGTTIEAGVSFEASVERTFVTGGDNSFHDTFTFVTGTGPISLQFYPTASDAKGSPGSLSTEVGDLQYWFSDGVSPVTPTVITESNGDYVGGLVYPLFENLMSGAVYTLHVTGTMLDTGDYAVDVSAVPLPPAALAFGSALVGMGLLGRRRKNKETEAA